MVPVVEHGAGELTACIEVVLANQLVQLLAVGAVLHEVDLHHVHVAEVVEVVVLVPYIGNTTTHTCGEVTARLTEHYHSTACHVLTAVVAGTLDDGYGTRVAHTEALAHLTVDVQLTACGTIETGVTCDDVVLGREVAADGRKDRNTTSRETLAEVVVSLTLELEVDTLYKETAEALACGALELHVHGLVGQSCLTILGGDETAQHHTGGTVGILDGEVEVYLFLVLDGSLRTTYQLLVEHVVKVVYLLGGMIERAVSCLTMEETGEVEQVYLVVDELGCLQVVGIETLCRHYLLVLLADDKFCMTDDVVQRGVTHLCQVLAYLLGEEAEVVDEVLVAAAEVGTELRILRSHTHRAGIEVTLAHHHTAQHDEGCRTEAELLGTEQSHEDDVATALQLTVHLQADLSAQAVLHQGLLCLGETNLWRDTCETHTGGRAGTRTALGT